MHKKFGGKRCMAALLSASLVLSSAPVTMAEDNMSIITETEELSQESNGLSEIQDEAVDDEAEDISVERTEGEEQTQILDIESGFTEEDVQSQASVYTDNTGIDTQSVNNEKDMKVSQIFEGITKDQIPENFALEWKVTNSKFADYHGTLEKKDAEITEEDGKVTLSWVVKVPHAGGLDITFTGKNYEVEGYEAATKYANNYHVSTDFGASPQRVTNIYTRKYSIEYYNEDGSQLLYTDVKKTNADTCSFSVYKGAEKKEGYELVGWAKHPYANVTDTSYNLKKGPSLTKDQSSVKLYAVYAKNVKNEQVTINVHLEYIDNSLEDGYQVSKAYIPVTVNCLTTYDHKETGAVHQVKYHDIIEALGGFEDFAVRKGYEIVGMTPNEGADETVFDLDNTFMQSGRENGGDFYLVAKKVYTLSYDGNASGVSAVPEGTKVINASGSVSFTISDKVPVRSGYSFSGWSTEKNGKVLYQPGQTITTDGNKQNVILYGIWQKNQETETEPKKDQETEKKPETTVKTSTALNLRASGSNKAISLKWAKIPEASGYEVYAMQCGSASKYKLVKTLKNKASVSWKQTGLKKGTSYSYYVRAYATVNGKKVYLTKSNTVHVVTSGGKATNVKKISVKKSSIILKKGKTQTLKLKVTYEKKNKKLLGHTAKYTYTSSNSKVATVSKKGVVKAVGKGTCVINVRAENGVSATVKVTVK